jgi:hypothetical protein
MPYIEQNNRVKFDEHLDNIKKIETKGELEYCIFKLMKIYMQDKTFNYSNLHDTVYSAIHCGDEFRREFLDKRENTAKENNGIICPLLQPENPPIPLVEDDAYVYMPKYPRVHCPVTIVYRLGDAPCSWMNNVEWNGIDWVSILKGGINGIATTTLPLKYKIIKWKYQ